VASIILEDIPLWPKPVPTTFIHSDNQAAISKAQNFVYNSESRLAAALKWSYHN